MSELNDAQKRAVAVRRNAVVTAGAGSGKTRVIAERYLGMIEEGTPVEEILCLTFTRKAAAEMYERIYRSLLDRRERSAAARRAVAQFEKAHISTLDSFSGRIVRSAALELGVNPDFAVDEEELRRVMEGESLRFLLRHGEAPAMEGLLAARGFSGVWQELLLSLATSYFSLAREESLVEPIERQRAVLSAAMRGHLRAISAQTRTIAGLDPKEGKSVAKAVEAVTSLDLDHGAISEDDIDLQCRRARSGDEMEELLGWLRNLTFTLEGINKPGSGSKEGIVLLREAVEALRPESEQLRRIGVYLDTFAPGLMELLEEFRVRVLQVKRQQGLLSYQDVVELSITALRDNRELREFYKRRYSRIMIDEFQDNNNDQRELLFLLSEASGSQIPGIPDAASLSPEKLFFVGDEKQSIYRFRGADVSVFKGLSDELSRAGGESIELRTNYRSEPPLIRVFNALFEEIFRDSREEFDARFQPLEPREEEAPLPSRCHLAILDGNRRDPDQHLSNAESEAHWIASTIKAMMRDPEHRIRDRDSGELRPPRVGDFAVLFRSSGNQYALERMLRLHDIPYGSQSIRSFFIEAPAYDIYAFLQTLIYPEDRVAYATLLRSPFLSIGDDTVLELLLSRGEAFSQPAQVISDPGDRRKYEAARERYLEAAEIVDRRSTTELVDHLWFEAGYRQFLLSDPMNHPYLEHYEYLFQLAKRFEARPMEEFLRSLRGSLGEFERLEELELPEGTGRVELLTIHKSKGLEFPVVFVMDMGNTGRSSRGPGYFVDEEHGLLIDIHQDPLTQFSFQRGSSPPGNYFARRAEEREKLRAEAELRRLLYVAATRAESHLFFSGYLHERNTKTEENRSMLQILAHALGIDLREAAENGFPESALEGAIKIGEIEHLSREEYQRLFRGRPAAPVSGVELYTESEVVEKRALRRRILPSEFNEFALHRQTGEELGPLFSDAGPVGSARRSAPERFTAVPGVGGGEEERALGTLAHRVIELRIQELQSGANMELEPDWLAALFKNTPRERQEELLGEAHAMARRFFDSELWHSLRGAERMETELSVLARYDHPLLGVLLLQGQFDLYAEVDGRCEVVDFKTDRRLQPREYVYQLSLYREAAEALSGVPGRTRIFGLRDGEIHEMESLERREMDELLAAYVLG
ncbi:MAG: UvrD-helicase domain-containing protein [Spirochaetaceae bacterium]